MTDVRRREALLLAAGLTGAAALGTLLRPGRSALPALPVVNLEAMFPQAFGAWRVDLLSRAFVRPAPDQGRRYEIYEQVLERTFIDAEGRRVMLSVAAGNDRSTRMQLHLPEVCYRAAGYQVGDTTPVPVALAGRRFTATRLVAHKPGRPEPITYWTVVGDQVVHGIDAFEDRRNGFVRQHQVVDGMLVRISSIDPDAQRAWPVHDRFAQELAGALAPAARVKVFGTDLARAL